ncbi:hypothetical protein SAMN00120144_2904 [Hymenobacter roseosalivarius DSM 11622]|uniref:Uncharacterized protein n=1 Tax=Hymenobacter roseosalivarius DSM 11622 TaxID=645990 RepID=A0A1W1VIE4_9BACT|nr:hypothetical protein SAMN00120144_2904 [Hymenobacter roseosalivarius DSM 11622]
MLVIPSTFDLCYLFNGTSFLYFFASPTILYATASLPNRRLH